MNTAHIATLACLTLAPLALAQEDGRPRIQEVTVEFQGGSLESLLDRIRGQGENGVNIVSSAMAKDVELPKLTLRKADVYSALSSVGSIAPTPYEVRINQTQQGGLPVYSVQVRLMQQQGQGFVQPEQLRVFSLQEVTVTPKDQPTAYRLDVTTVLTAIDTGLSVSDDRKATIRYHEESHLMFIRGTMSQVQMVDNVLTQLRLNVQNRRNAEIRAAQAARSRGAGK